jgi:hypothetical protein
MPATRHPSSKGDNAQLAIGSLREHEIVVYFILRGLPREAAIQIARLAERGSPVNPIEL